MGESHRQAPRRRRRGSSLPRRTHEAHIVASRTGPSRMGESRYPASTSTSMIMCDPPYLPWSQQSRHKRYIGIAIRGTLLIANSFEMS